MPRPRKNLSLAQVATPSRLTPQLSSFVLNLTRMLLSKAAFAETKAPRPTALAARLLLWFLFWLLPPHAQLAPLLLPAPDARLACPTPLLDAILQEEMALLRLTSTMLIRPIFPTAIALPSPMALRPSDSVSAALC
jgi:hypothetical protein